MGKPPVPMWSETTIPVAAHTSKNGSQAREWIEGRPITWGASGKEMERKSRSARRLASATASSTSHSGTIPIGTRRPAEPAHHSSITKSFQARMQARPSSLSAALENCCPQKRTNMLG